MTIGARGRLIGEARSIGGPRVAAGEFGRVYVTILRLHGVVNRLMCRRPTRQDIRCRGLRMSGLDLNKFVGAALVVALSVVVINMIGNTLVYPRGEVAAVAVAAKAPAKPAAPAAKQKVGLTAVTPLLTAADIEAGMKVAKKCAACHTLTKGGKNKIGPGLWNIVGAKKADVAGFSYSSAMKDKGGEWSYENLNAFLFKPKAYLPGTKMSFGGLKKAKDRANLIAYLRSLADTPAPLP
jgi:cytochrome c